MIAAHTDNDGEVNSLELRVVDIMRVLGVRGNVRLMSARCSGML